MSSGELTETTRPVDELFPGLTEALRRIAEAQQNQNDQEGGNGNEN